MTVNNLQPADIAYLASRPVTWIGEHCQIESKAGKRVALRANYAQLVIESVIDSLQATGRPVKIIVLKARQEGVTSWGLARMYQRCATRPNHRAMMAAHKSESSTKLFERVQLFRQYDPDKREVQFSNRREIKFAQPHGSSLSVDTAGDDDLGRSGTLIDLHNSELAFWPDAKKSLTAALACVPSPADNPDTMVIIESTPNGMGGEFYDRWCSARPWRPSPWVTLPQGKSDYIAIFLPWHTFPDYRMPVPKGFVRTDEERGLALRYDLSDEQLAWRRYTIANNFDGDTDLFLQEFAACDEECFRVSGRPVFAADALAAMSAECRPPRIIGRMADTAEGPVLLTCSEREGGWVEVWQLPQEGETYAIGADTAEGFDKLNNNDPDANSAHVIRVSTRQIVAKCSGRFDPDLFGEQLNLLGRLYNDALLGVEVNNSSGGSTRSTLRRLDYPNLFYREIIDRTTDEMTERIGWYTDKVTRETLITDLAKVIRERRIHVYSAQTMHQLRCFVRVKTGKAQAAPGEHDDDTMSLGLTWQMAAQAAQSGGSLVADTAGEPARGYVRGDDRRKFMPSYVIGGCEADPEPLGEEDEV